MKTIIIEDNEFDQLILKKFVEEDKELELKGVFENAIEAISLIKVLNPDLIILDIEMPKMTGIEFLKAIKNVPQIVIISAHKEYASEAYENDVTDFITKPATKERFNKAISKAKQIHAWLSLETQDEESIFVRVERDDIKISLKKIKYIEAMADYIKIITESKKLMVLSTMKSIETKLPSEDFVRIHRSFIVNKAHITSYNSTEVNVDGICIPVSRAGKKLLNKIKTK